MKRFENAQVGDLVYSMIHGDCFIIEIDSECICIRSEEDNFLDMTYNKNGCFFYDVGEPVLFYRKGPERYLTERPEPEIDWSKVPMGTKVFTYLKKEDINDPYWNKDEDIEMFMGYFPNLERPFWSFDGYGRETASGRKYCKLAEPCKIEWIKNND